MLLRAFVCARNVRDGNDDGQVVEEEKFDVSGWAKSREKKIMGERGYFIYSKNCGIAKENFHGYLWTRRIFVCCTGNLEMFVRSWRKKELLKGRKNY